MPISKKKKEAIRNQIIVAANEYRNNLSGKVYLYVVGSKYFEVAFLTGCFKHLTGVNSNLSAKDFYSKAVDATLATGQIYFDRNHPYLNSKKKLCYLGILSTLTNSLVCVTEGFNTRTITYKLGITNFSFTIGLSEHLDNNGNKLNNWYIPQTLRVNDRAVENSLSAEFADFIFCKSAVDNKYKIVTYLDEGKVLPDEVMQFLSQELRETLSN